jgi:ubiquinone/menaquinone biosynthesis C-methylase UbiE
MTTNETVKTNEHETWKSVAQAWNESADYVARVSQPTTQKMIEHAHLQTGQRVLDIACGTGEPALPMAERVGPNGKVIATDLVEEMVRYTSEQARRRGLTNVEARRVDGEALDFPAETFDVVSIRWGIMFMPDPLACLRDAHRVLKRGGRIVVSTWAGPEQNGWIAKPMGLLRGALGVPAPAPGAVGLFAFADKARLSQVLAEGGFSEVIVESVTLPIVDFATRAEYVGLLVGLVGPFQALWQRLADSQKATLRAQIEAMVAPSDGRFTIEGVNWVASGVK